MSTNGARIGTTPVTTSIPRSEIREVPQMEFARHREVVPGAITLR